MAIQIRQAESIVWGAFSFGTVNSVVVDAKGIPAGRDSKGCTQSAGFDVKLSFNMMDNDRDKIYALIGLPKTKASLTIEWKSDESFVMPSCLPFIETLKVDADGKPSEIKVTFDRILTEGEAQGLITEI